MTVDPERFLLAWDRGFSGSALVVPSSWVHINGRTTLYLVKDRYRTRDVSQTMDIDSVLYIEASNLLTLTSSLYSANDKYIIHETFYLRDNQTFWQLSLLEVGLIQTAQIF